jgi:hypothetical protein
MKKCKHCGKEYQPKNPKGKYCSDKCRVYGNRGKVVIDYVPPPIFTSKDNLAKLDDAFKQPIKEQIEQLQKELYNCPKEYSETGRIIWRKEREKKIQSLQQQLKL